MREEVLRLQHVAVREKGVTVLNDVNLQLFKGEILGLLFVDYQGRSALVDLVCRNRSIHYGMVWFKEAKVNSYRKSPLTQNSVTVIDGKTRLVDGMTVADNIFVLRPGFKKFFIRPAVLACQLAQFTRAAGVQIEGGTLVRSLSLYEKCVVQLVKAAIIGHSVVVLQDISDFVSAVDLARFHALIQHFAAQGMAFLYLCNHHEELFAFGHRAMLFSSGQVLREIPASRFSQEDLSMYGYPAGYFGPSSSAAEDAQSLLCFAKVCTPHLKGLSFSLMRGECAALLDTSGSALADVFSLLGGQMAPLAGQVLMGNEALTRGRKSTLPKGVGLIAQNPVESMLFPHFSYLHNLCFLAGEKMPKLWRSQRLRQNILREYHPFLGEDIYAVNIEGLSAGSLYNLIYYSQYLRNPSLLVIQQPFFGADLYLRTRILGLIDILRKRGTAVLLLSVNISDIPVVADRMLVLQNGSITREYGQSEMPTLNQRKFL